MSDKIQNIGVSLLDPSPTQPRKKFSKEDHELLCESMREHGFAFGCLLVRAKDGGRFEIIIGERRTRAAKAIGLPSVPCEITTLPQFRTFELQLVENLHRADLSPIEEAEGYAEMLKIVDDKGRRLHPTIESVALRVGKKPDVVRRQIQLCKLPDETKAAVEAKILPKETAYLISKIVTPGGRLAASEKILHPEANAGENGILSYRDSRDLIIDMFQRDLRKASFEQSDEILVPPKYDELKMRVCGGSCLDCPQKSGNLPGADISRERKNSCLYPPCYDEKNAAEWQRWQERETDPERKRRALSREECLEIFSTELPTQPRGSSGLVNLDQYPTSDELKAGEESPSPWRVLTERAELEIVVVRDKYFKTHELVNRELAIQAAKANGHTFFKSNERDKQARRTRKALGLTPPADISPLEGKSQAESIEIWLNTPATRDEVDAQRKEQEKARSAADERARLLSNSLFDALRKRDLPAAAGLRFLLLYIFGQRTPNETLLKRYKLPVAEDISRNVKKWKETESMAFMIEFILTDAGHNFEFDDDDHAWLKLFGVDVKAQEKALAKEKKRK